MADVNEPNIVGEVSLSGYQNADRLEQLQGRYYGAYWLGRERSEPVGDSGSDFNCQYVIIPADGYELIEAKFVQPERAFVEYDASPAIVEQALDILEELRATQPGPDDGSRSYVLYQDMAESRYRALTDVEVEPEAQEQSLSMSDLALADREVEPEAQERSLPLSGLVLGLGGIAAGSVAALSWDRAEFPLEPATGVFVVLGYITILLTAYLHRRRGGLAEE